MCMRLSSSEHSKGPQHLGQAVLGAGPHSDTAQCPPQSPDRKVSERTASRAVASHGIMTLRHHCLALGWMLQFQEGEKSPDFEVGPTWVQIPALSFNTA